MKIPTYEPRVDIPAEGTAGRAHFAPLDFLSEVPEAMGRAARSMGAAASGLSEALKRKREQEEYNWVVESLNGFSETWRNAAAEELEKTGLETLGNVERMQGLIKDQSEKYLANAPSDAARRTFTYKVGSLTDHMLFSMARLQAGERKTTGVKNLDSVKEAQRKMAYLDPDHVDKYAAAAIGALDGAMASGVLPVDEQTATQLGVKIEQSVYAAALDGYLDRSPALARQKMADFTPFLSADQLNAYANRIDSKEKSLLLDAERSEAMSARQRKELLDGVELDTWSKLRAGKLTQTEIESLRERRLIDPNSYNALSQALQTGEGLDDPGVRLHIEDRVLTGQAGREEILGAVGRGISHKTAFDLLQKSRDVARQDDVSKQPDYKAAMDYVDDQIKTRGLMETLDPTDQARRANARRELDERLRNPEESRLGVWKIADDIVQRYRPAPMSPKSLPVPRYFTGPRNDFDGPAYDPESLEETERKTIEAFKANEISTEALGRELDNLKRIRGLLDTRKPSKPISSEDVKKRMENR